MSARVFSPDAPDSPFPLLPLRNGVLYPGQVTTLAVGRPQSLALLRDARPGQTIVGVGVQRDPHVLDPRLDDLYPTGVYARVAGISRQGKRGTLMLSLQGLSRFELTELVTSTPTWMVDGVPIREPVRDEVEARFLADALRQQLGQGDNALAKVLGAAPPHESPGRLADRIAAGLKLPVDKAVQILETPDVIDRLRLVTGMVSAARALEDVRQSIDAEVRSQLSKNQREHILREQLKAIKRELGEDAESDANKLQEQLDEADLPDEVRAVVVRELKRLDGMNAAQAEANVIRTYVEWLLALPWRDRAEVHDDIDQVSDHLDADHYGLDEVKKRILEHLAVLKVAGNPRGTILCLVGPPGVGKTSLGQSIADATGRPFARIALGGVRDEAEIRGHRRTYVGALPGRVIATMKKVGAKNPVILLDEIDKLGKWWTGSPESALLEVLDPEQNHTFTDHYVELPFDLSEVLFICTANQLDGISGPLRDRLEIVEISGYTHEEKTHIARNHLIPRHLEDHGIHEDALTISDAALKAIISDYTREAGVRQLGRQIIRLCRALALQIARNPEASATLNVETDDLDTLLGKKKHRRRLAEESARAGVATGLAWTPVGGDILFIETSRMRGNGKIEITGKLGDVMNESARAALTYVRSHADALGIDADVLDGHDLHIHVPAGAVPKDGPSAGVTIFTAITSLMVGRPVRTDTAMTGECTLRGRVLPVGGIKAKVLAAHRAGIRQVILPHENAQDLEDIPDSVRDDLEFVLAEDMSDVLAAALVDTTIAPAPAAAPLTGADTSGAPAVAPSV